MNGAPTYPLACAPSKDWRSPGRLLRVGVVAGFIVAILDGELESAVRSSERLVACADELGAPITGRQFTREANCALAHLGRSEEALTRLGAARQMAGAEASVLEQASTAQLLAHAGRSAVAREVLRGVMAELNISTKRQRDAQTDPARPA